MSENTKVPIPGYCGFYEVDMLGRIFRVGSAKPLKAIEHSSGYSTVNLSKQGKVKTHRYHRLVAEALIPNTENKPYVNHIDGDKRNNVPTNLEWVTESENCQHAINTGLTNNFGTNNPACKVTRAEVEVWLSMILEGKQIKEIAKIYSVDRNSVSRLINIEFPGKLPKYRER